MIFEIAQIEIDQQRGAAFEAAVSEAEPLFRAAKGFRSFELTRSIEHPGRYRLTIGWVSVEAHTVDFRGSADFERWRSLAGSFFLGAPIVEHVRRILPREDSHE